MQQGMVYFPKDAIWTGPLVAELLGSQMEHMMTKLMLTWIGLMMTEFASYIEKEVHVPSWRDKLKTYRKRC